MSIPQESREFLSKSPNETQNLGFSLARSLYSPSSKFLLLRGELGAGKTTFIQGIGFGLGFGEGVIQSPTYAVERDYQGKLLHLDLFRIPPEEAVSILERANEYDGLVAVEWSEKLPEESLPEGRIEVKIEDVCRTEEPRANEVNRGASRSAAPLRGAMLRQAQHDTNNDRIVHITFLDFPIPSSDKIKQWGEETLVLPNVREHERAVAALSLKIGKILLKRNAIVRLKALEAAAEAHDLLRFVNFTDGTWKKFSNEQQKCWGEFKKRYPKSHEEACAEFLRERGYPVIGEIVSTHGVRDEPKTTEQKILYYADKRMCGDRLVSIDERFADYAVRYGPCPEQAQWVKKAKEIEKELFPEGPPL
jgi:tRNA threonylcarbamoyladenosine biosynthesis protein TsaE